MKGTFGGLLERRFGAPMADGGRLFFHRATPPQTGAVGVFHLFGDEAELRARFEARLRPLREIPMRNNELRFAIFMAGDGSVVDETLVAKPREGMRILMCHGGRRIMEKAGETLAELGALPPNEQERPAGALGENESDARIARALARTYADGQVATILEERVRSRAEGRFPEIREDWLRVRRAALAGPPNAGKSSLLNCLAGFDRAFVHAEAGATRDAVEELVELAGRPVLVQDLPGMTECRRGILGEAMEKAAARIGGADMVLFVCDGSAGWTPDHEAAARTVAAECPESTPILAIRNKSDLPSRLQGAPWRGHFTEAGAAAVSALDADGTRRTIAELAAKLWGSESGFRFQ